MPSNHTHSSFENVRSRVHPASAPSSGNLSSHSYNGGDSQRSNDRIRRGGGGGNASNLPTGGTASNQNNNPSNANNNHRRRNTNQSHIRYQDLPLEQGVICTVRDSFGFIYCADRPEEIFFHFSQLLPHNTAASPASIVDEANAPPNSATGARTPASDTLQVDMEVEFRVGKSQKDADKLAAYQVRILEPGTIQWEIVEEESVRGLVERPVNNNVDGMIKIFTSHDEEAPPDGPVVKFGHNDYKVPVSADFRKASSARLARGDTVQFTLVTDRRTKDKYARNITMILSARDRAMIEHEKQQLANATEEHGVITSLKGDYGFIRSNKRREEVYFHYSSLEMEGGDEGGEESTESAEKKIVLREGQDMKFLVVTEGGGSFERSQRLSARQVTLQPRGSVKFHDVLAAGVTGTVSLVPHHQDSGHALETKGKVLLSTPIKDRYNGNERIVKEVYLCAQDSPGGCYSFRGGTSVGLWIEIGDTLLFDVVKDYADGACRAVPTKHVLPCDDPTDFENVLEAQNEEDGENRAIYLLRCALPMRSEGVVNALKDTYGFVHFVERPVDAHFKLFQLLPDDLQSSLRRGMGLPDTDSHGRPLRLEIGAEAQFDLSVHGSIMSHSTRHRSQKPQQTHERENLKAQRVLLLPPGTIVHNFTLGTDLRGVVVKDNPKQPYSGTLQLDDELQPMSPEQRHPLVAQMITDFLANEELQQIEYHDLQSQREDDVVREMISYMGQGRVAIAYLPNSGDEDYQGRLCIKKLHEVGSVVDDDHKHTETLEASGSTTVGDGTNGDVPHDHPDDDYDDMSTDEISNDDVSGDALDEKRKPRKKKHPKASQPVKLIRFDKSSLSLTLRDDVPPRVGDIVQLDVIQSRRTGQFQADNLKIVSRNRDTVELADALTYGIVKEVQVANKSGLITVANSNDDDTIFHFDFSSVVSAKKKKGFSLRQGDKVQFKVGNDKSGRSIAVNITPVSSFGTSADIEKDMCRGLVLLEPALVAFKTTPTRQVRRTDSSEKSGSRWNSIEDDRKQSAADDECGSGQGQILLLHNSTAQGNPPKSADVANSENLSRHSSNSDSGKYNDGTVIEGSSRVFYRNAELSNHSGVGNSIASSSIESSKPRRGDLVSFSLSKSGGARNVVILNRGEAAIIRGRLEGILAGKNIDPKKGSAKFITTERGDVYSIPLSEVVSCDPSLLKEKEAVEGIVYNGSVFGVCRIADLYMESKFNSSGSGVKERPKLNLTARKDRCGKIQAQSMIAKGPDDGSNGFQPGWTKRMSAYATPFVPNIGV